MIHHCEISCQHSLFSLTFWSSGWHHFIQHSSNLLEVTFLQKLSEKGMWDQQRLLNLSNITSSPSLFNLSLLHSRFILWQDLRKSKIRSSHYTFSVTRGFSEIFNLHSYRENREPCEIASNNFFRNHSQSSDSAFTIIRSNSSIVLRLYTRDEDAHPEPAAGKWRTTHDDRIVNGHSWTGLKKRGEVSLILKPLQCHKQSLLVWPLFITFETHSLARSSQIKDSLQPWHFFCEQRLLWNI
jgi:hypothetical protein